jgi:hypothetical protein
MELDAGAVDTPSVGGDRYVDNTCKWKQPPEGRRTCVAQYGARPVSQHGCKPPALLAETGVTNRVDTAMHGVEPPRLHTPRNPAPANPRLLQLRARDHAMLPGRNARNEIIGSVEFCTHVGA